MLAGDGWDVLTGARSSRITSSAASVAQAASAARFLRSRQGAELTYRFPF